MQRTKLNFDKFHWANLSKLAAVAILLTACFPIRSMAQQQGQKTFSSPEDASNALVTAAQNNDEKAMLEILGPDGKQIVSSGDETEDAESRANFVAEISGNAPSGERTGWNHYFVYRRGELAHAHTAREQRQFVVFRHRGGQEGNFVQASWPRMKCRPFAFARSSWRRKRNTTPRSTTSTPRKSSVMKGSTMAFIGKLLMANPRAPSGRWWHRPLPRAMPKARDGAPTPYRGYYYHILTRQGKNAPGGAKSYIVNGKMTEGFAFVAYPAEYRSSGVMTFIVGEDGVVYQKDLGKKTDALAKAMKEYNPNSSWQKAEDQQEENAGEQQTK